jgi:hypothetical protein
MATDRTVFGIALASVTVMFCAFLAGVVNVLDASDGPRVFWQVVFVLSGGVLVGTIIQSIMNLVRKRNEVVSVASLLVPVIPIALIVIVGTVG